jgi:hypothetical protein
MQTNQVAHLVGVVLGQAETPHRAAEIADRYAGCPYCASLSNKGSSLMGIFTLPQERRWWLEGIADDPGTQLGLQTAEVLETNAIKAASPWSRGEVKPNLHPAPCGSDCRQCDRYGACCVGCPATLDYRGS